MKPWSHSSLKTFESCPRRYHQTKVVKAVQEEETEEQNYGTRFHEAAEMLIKEGRPLPEEFKFAAPVLCAVALLKGKAHAELEMGVTVDLKPCAFDAPDVWARGIVDAAVHNGKLCTIVDWKTGGDKFPDKEQLTLMSLLTFAHFPEVEKVRAALIFVVKSSMVRHEVSKAEAPIFWADYRQRAAVMEQCFANDVWNPKHGPFCRGWCPVTDCEYWSPKKRR